MNIDDIARIAGVSKTAVSLAFNNKPGVSEEKRKHILSVAKEHNYIPRLFSTRKVETKPEILRFIACKNEKVVTSDYASQQFFSELIHEITEISRQEKFSLQISSIDDNLLLEEIKDLEQAQASAGILILGTSLPDDKIQELKQCHKNIVIIDTSFPHIDINFVGINNFLGGYQAGKHLLNLGHTSIGYIESRARINNFEQRKEGFRAALQEHELHVKTEHTFIFHPTLIKVQEEFQEHIMQMDQLPTALFCENDYMAISTIKSLQAIGIRIPEDISILGFDDIPQASITTPELTTIAVDKVSIARNALHLIKISKNSHNVQSISLMVNTHLIDRGSCTLI